MFIGKSILAFAAVLSTAAVAHAAPEADVPQMTVHIGDLNLATKSGVATLYSRMQSASRAACASYGEGHSPSDVRINRSCRDDLISQGVEQMHSSALAALASADPKSIQVAFH